MTYRIYDQREEADPAAMRDASRPFVVIRTYDSGGYKGRQVQEVVGHHSTRRGAQQSIRRRISQLVRLGLGDL